MKTRFFVALCLIAVLLCACTKPQNDKISDPAIIASYNGYDITANMVEYQREMNLYRSEEAAKEYDTDMEIANRIIESVILLEEAERLGIAATDAEIEEMVDNAVRAYSTPEGKKTIDVYCQDFGITADQYFDLLREQASRTIARQKLQDAVGKQYCDENGLIFTKVNPPEEMRRAQDAYIKELLEKHKKDIVYYIDE